MIMYVNLCYFWLLVSYCVVAVSYPHGDRARVGLQYVILDNPVYTRSVLSFGNVIQLPNHKANTLSWN